MPVIPKISKNNLFIAVFSYNRGKYLKNCIESIERNLSTENIYIYDDNSEDKKTIAILKELSNKYPVEINKKKPEESRRGGLYINMNKALKKAIYHNFKYILFTQDDIQIVRKIDGAFLEECSDIFCSNNNIVQILPVFFKKSSIKEINRTKNINYLSGYYYPKNRKDDGIVDIGLIRVDKLKKINWKWNPRKTEAENRKIASKNKWKLVFSKNPAMMYLPYPETFRSVGFMNKTYSNILKNNSKMGFHPYEQMTNEEVCKLLNRDISVFPTAEKYLETINKELKKPWIYSRPHPISKLKRKTYLLIEENKLLYKVWSIIKDNR